MSSKPRFVGEKVRVSDAFDLRMGKTPSRKNPAYWRDGGHDWVSIADLGSFGKYVGVTKERINDLAISESGIKPAPANTVLMSFKLSLGKTSITTEPVYTNEAIMAFVDKGVYPVDASFMYHQCRAKDWTAGTNTAVMGKTLNKKTLGQAYVHLPALEVQKMIAARLDFIDEQIRASKSSADKLEHLVKSRFVEMFASGGFPSVSFGDVCLKINNGITRRGNDPDGDIVLRLVELQQGFIDYAKPNRIRLTQKEKERFSLVDGDLLFARVNGNPKNVGRCASFSAINESVYHNDHVIRATFDHSKYNPVFLVFFMNSSKGRAQIEAAITTSAGQYTINQAGIKSIQVPLPPLAFQQEFAAFVSQVDKSGFAS